MNNMGSVTPELPLRSVSVIVPVFNGGNAFHACLAGIRDLSPAPYEVIVVVDGDDACSVAVARDSGVKVLNPERRGPAAARNLGAFRAKGEILFFTDADVVLPSNAIRVVAEALSKPNATDAIIGGYDDTPLERNFFSQFKNLFHHYIHQNASETALTFWGACGAIKKDVFRKIGGFDTGYRMPSIEDIELGYRLSEAGFSIRMAKSLKVTHLKKWSFKSIIITDIFHRAVPWTRLMLRHDSFPTDLNLRVSDRMSAIFALLFFVGLLLSLKNGIWLVPALLNSAILITINRKLYGFFYKKGGISFMIRSIAWHWIYYCYSLAGFLIGFLLYLRDRIILKIDL